MKTILSLVILALFFVFDIQKSCGQTLSGIGFQGGGGSRNINTIQTPETTDHQGKLGASAGLRFEFDLASDIVLFSPEIFFYQNGTKFYQQLPDLQADLFAGKVSLDYFGIYLPLTINLPLNDEEQYNGIVIGAKSYIDYSTKGTLTDANGKENKLDFRGPTGRIDLGYAFEAGFVVNGVSLLFGYNKGIKDIEFNDSIITGNESNYIFNNKGLSFQIGYVSKFK